MTYAVKILIINRRSLPYPEMPCPLATKSPFRLVPSGQCIPFYWRISKKSLENLRKQILAFTFASESLRIMEARRDVFQAIADPTRRAIIGMVAKEPVNVNAIAEQLYPPDQVHIF